MARTDPRAGAARRRVVPRRRAEASTDRPPAPPEQPVQPEQPEQPVQPVQPVQPALPRRDQVIGVGLTWLARWSLRWLLIAGGAVLLGLVVREIWVVLLPVLLALIVASVLEPLARLLERRLHAPPALAAALTLLAAVVLLVGVGYAIARSVARNVDQIAADASTGLQQVQDWVQSSNMITEDQLDSVLQSAQDRLTDSASTIASGLLVGVGAVGSGVVTLVLTLLLCFFFLKDGRRFSPWVRSMTGPRVGGHLVEVLRRCWATLGGFIRTQALVSLIDAVFIGIGLLVVGVPLAVPLAVLTFFGGFVPIVGAFVVGGIAVLVALVSVGWVGALVVLGLIVAVQQLEGNVLQPWLQSRVMDLHPVVVLLAVTLGGTLFGIVGAFLAVPVVAVLAVVLRYLNGVVVDQTGSGPGTEAQPS